MSVWRFEWRVFYIGLEGQIHFGMPSAKMSLIANEPIHYEFWSNLHISPKDALKTYLTWNVLYAK